MSLTKTISKLQENVSKVIIGKSDSIELVVVCLLSGGHILLEDMPGLGKTVLAKSLAKSIHGRFKRVQCTPDLLPSDVTGISIYNEKTREFEFKPGPVFANILLVDEINRTTPRTQSSLLEAMAERQVSVDGKTFRLPLPNIVIATQNPIDNHGTYPLPEAQLDRFLMRISLGYPTLEDEITIMQSQQKKHPLENISAVATPEDIAKLQAVTQTIKVEPEVVKYIAKIIHATRAHKYLIAGGSPRASLALMRASQAIALIRGKTFVDPQMVKNIAPHVLAHRISLKPQHMGKYTTQTVIAEILSEVEVPLIKDVSTAAQSTEVPSLQSSNVNATTKTAAATAPKKKVETTDTGMELFEYDA